jgi:signal transduction histidine kinase
VSDALVVCRDHGVDVERLTSGLSVSPEQLADPRHRVEWDVLAQVIDRMAAELGGPEAYGDALAAFVDHPDTHRARRFLQVTTDPLRNYQLVFRWAGRFMFPFVHAEVDIVGPRRVRVVNHIREPLAPSLPFITSAVAFARALPRIHGLPDAHVEVLEGPTPRRVVLEVDVPERRSRRAQLKQLAAAAISGASAVEELFAHQEELERLYAEAREREAELRRQIADKEAAKRSLSRREEQLRSAQRLESVGRLAGGLAHDVNNRMAAISGYVEQALEHTSEPKVEQALRAVLAQVDEGAERAHRLLTFARREPVERRPMELGAALDQALHTIGPMLGSIRAVVERGEEALWGQAVPARWEQMVLQLVLNASDALDGTGTVRIGLARDGAHALLTVVDEGHGMAQPVMSRAMEPFFTTRDGRDGLGLSTVYGVVREAGGSVELSSREGEGTTVRVRWPLVEPAAQGPEPEAEQGATEGPEAGPTGVLVIDDEPALRRLMGQMLARRGFDVVTAAHRDEALGHVRGGQVGLVVSDLMLEGERGPAVVEALRQVQPSLKVLYVTGYGEHVVLDAVQGERVLLKPFPMAALADAVEELLGAS